MRSGIQVSITAGNGAGLPRNLPRMGVRASLLVGVREVRHAIPKKESSTLALGRSPHWQGLMEKSIRVTFVLILGTTPEVLQIRVTVMASKEVCEFSAA